MLGFPRLSIFEMSQWKLVINLVVVIPYFIGIGATDQCDTSTQVYRIKEVSFTDGTAGATSFWDENSSPNQGFFGHQPWHLGAKNGPPSPLPVMIWYDFKSTGIRPAEVSFQPWQSNSNGQNIQRAPTSYQFVGSNDASCSESTTWTVLCEDLSNAPWEHFNDTKYCKVKPELKEKFRCLGLRVLKNRSGDGWVALRNIRIWERVEKKCSCEEN